jgi:diguanylate cyclase (GGDEF)-like protein
LDSGDTLSSEAQKHRLVGLEKIAEAERLRLALAGARIAAFDWVPASGHIDWDGLNVLLESHPKFAELSSAKVFLNWLGSETRDRLNEYAARPAADDAPFTAEFQAVTGVSREWFEIRAIALSGGNGPAERVTGLLREITGQKTALSRLTHLANCDELTGHLNRTRLREELAKTIAAARAEKLTCSYLVAAIDKLAVINESYGFDCADEVIVAAGQRLSKSLRGRDVIGRTGGNKFGLILFNCSERQMSQVAERLIDMVRSEAIETSAGSVSATISVGAVWLPAAANTSQEAMLHAEEALERAKRKGRNGLEIYTKSSQRETERRRLGTIGDEVTAALNEHRMVLAYQPIINARTRKPEHYECLLRMVRKDGSIAPAGEFVPAAEQLGLIRMLDRRALEMAVAQLYAYEGIKLSINVSGTTAGDQSWLQNFIAYVNENREVAERMTVELTETAALQAFEENARFVSRLRDMGCKVAIDDFGAGYTSFRNLHNLRVDMVKIDGDYVRNLSQSPDNQLFVRTLVHLAKNFELATVAEWVDSEEDAKLLERFGVDFFQGFYFGKPETKPEWMTAGVATYRQVDEQAGDQNMDQSASG